MGTMIQIRKKDKKFRFWSTITDSYISDFMTREEAVEFLQARVKSRAKEECKEIAEKFPNGYYDKNSRRIIDYKV